MTRAVWKFPLALTAEPQVVTMPRSAQIVHVGDQGGVPTIWAHVEDTAETKTVDRHMIVRGTGDGIPDGYRNYVGIVFRGPFVFHIWERVVIESTRDATWSGPV